MTQYADKVFEMLVNGTPISKAWEHAQTEKWDITREQFDGDVQAAYETMTSKGNPDPEIERGRAVERLHRLYFHCMRIQDFKAALSVQREINTLVGLKQKPGRPASAKDALAAASANARALLGLPATNGTAKRRKVKA
jgi:hypothetical protein